MFTFKMMSSRSSPCLAKLSGIIHCQFLCS
jgi:hypothetical protein